MLFTGTASVKIWNSTFKNNEANMGGALASSGYARVEVGGGSLFINNSAPLVSVLVQLRVQLQLSVNGMASKHYNQVPRVGSFSTVCRPGVSSDALPGLA